MPNRSQIKKLLLNGGAPTLAQHIAALGLNSHLPCQDLTGVIARNALYTGGVGADLLAGAGAFASDTGWTVSAPWTIGSGVATYDDLSDNELTYAAGVALLRGESVRYNFDVANATANMLFRNETGGGVIIAAANYAAGAQEVDRVAPAALTGGARCRGTTTSTGAFTLDNWTIKKTGELEAAIAGAVTLNQTGKLGAGHAFDLDGATGVLSLYPASLDAMTNFTIAQLVKFDTLTNGDRLLFKDASLDLYVNADGSLHSTITYATTTASTDSAAAAVTTGVWYLIALSTNSADKVANITVNGVLVNSGTPTAGVGTRANNTNVLQIGKNATTGAFDGLLDEVYIDTDTEISTANLATLATLLGL